MLGIVDYGMGNLRSVQKAFEHIGVRADIIDTPEQIDRADKLIVPGVGAFPDAIATLREKHLDQAIAAFVQRGKPVLGICLGLQLLMTTGYEDGTHAGLNLIKGDCVRFAVDKPPHRLKVPHMGWNALEVNPSCPLFRGVESGSYAYFVHSYHVRPTDRNVVACAATYGQPFVAAVWKDNLMATQFHPEKSQRVGAAILRNFEAI